MNKRHNIERLAHLVLRFEFDPAVAVNLRGSAVGRRRNANHAVGQVGLDDPSGRSGLYGQRSHITRRKGDALHRSPARDHVVGFDGHNRGTHDLEDGRIASGQAFSGFQFERHGSGRIFIAVGRRRHGQCIGRHIYRHRPAIADDWFDIRNIFSFDGKRFRFIFTHGDNAVNQRTAVIKFEQYSGPGQFHLLFAGDARQKKRSQYPGYDYKSFHIFAFLINRFFCPDAALRDTGWGCSRVRHDTSSRPCVHSRTGR